MIQSAKNLEKHGVFKRLFKRQGEVQTNEEIEANFFDVAHFPNYISNKLRLSQNTWLANCILAER